MGGHFEDFHAGEAVDLSLLLFCSPWGDGSVQAAELKVWVFKSLTRSLCGCLLKNSGLGRFSSCLKLWPSVRVDS
jgi:hypothetical protein